MWIRCKYPKAATFKSFNLLISTSMCSLNIEKKIWIKSHQFLIQVVQGKLFFPNPLQPIPCLHMAAKYLQSSNHCENVQSLQMAHSFLNDQQHPSTSEREVANSENYLKNIFFPEHPVHKSSCCKQDNAFVYQGTKLDIWMLISIMRILGFPLNS